MRIIDKLRTATLAAAAALLVGACASPAGIVPGESVAAATQKLGTPTLEKPLPNGGRRLIWSTQPMGQYAWVTDTDADGRVVSNKQVLTTESFDRMHEGQWDTDRLLFEFGPPAEITRVGLRGEQVVWDYRYRQDGVWNSLMYVYVDKDGKVTRFHPGPDPLAEPQRFPFGM